MKILYDTMLPREWFERLSEHELIPDTCLVKGGNDEKTSWQEAEILTTNFYKPVRKELLDKLPKYLYMSAICSNFVVDFEKRNSVL